MWENICASFEETLHKWILHDYHEPFSVKHFSQWWCIQNWKACFLGSSKNIRVPFAWRSEKTCYSNMFWTFFLAISVLIRLNKKKNVSVSCRWFQYSPVYFRVRFYLVLIPNVLKRFPQSSSSFVSSVVSYNLYRSMPALFRFGFCAAGRWSAFNYVLVGFYYWVRQLVLRSFKNSQYASTGVMQLSYCYPSTVFGT